MNNMLFSVFHMRWLIQWIHINITDQEKSVSRCHTKCFVHRTMCSQRFPSAALSPTCHRCFAVKQNREAWGGFDMEGILRYSTSNVKWSGDLGWEVALNSPSGVARLSGHRWHRHCCGESSFIPTEATHLQNKCSYFTAMCFGQKLLESVI